MCRHQAPSTASIVKIANVMLSCFGLFRILLGYRSYTHAAFFAFRYRQTFIYLRDYICAAKASLKTSFSGGLANLASPAVFKLFFPCRFSHLIEMGIQEQCFALIGADYGVPSCIARWGPVIMYFQLALPMELRQVDGSGLFSITSGSYKSVLRLIL